MRLVFAPQAWEDYRHWQATDRVVLKRVNRLIDAVLRVPLDGIGKPERLEYGVEAAWSRRITEEHRLIYAIHGEDLVVLQARYHYSG